MSASSFFTCICLQKRLVLRNREEVQSEQQKALEQLVEQYDCNASLILGSGCIVSRDFAIGQAAGFAAIVSGTPETPAINAETPNKGLAGGGQADSQVPEAEAICQLYKKYGRMVPQKLKGDFSFVLFDPAQERVLAAVSPNSQVPLIQARGADGCLLITTSPAHELPVGSHSVMAIPAGFMKYGWSSDPQQFSAALPQTPRSDVFTPSGRARAAKLAFSGALKEEGNEEPQDSQASVQTSGPSFAESEGGEPQSPAPKKTRRGKRGGRNQKMRAESMKRQPADELARSSLEFTTLPSGTPSANSFSSKADEKNWWRTNTPRQSLELSYFPSGSLPSSSLLDNQGSGTPNFRRFSMSATAPAFVPGQAGLFTRQSIPVIRAKTTALSFPERDQAKKDSNNEIIYVAPRAIPTEEASMVSPFFNCGLGKAAEAGEPTAGKADAAWEEQSGSGSSQPSSNAQEQQSEGPSSTDGSRSIIGKPSEPPSAAAEKLSGRLTHEQGSSLPRVTIRRESSQKQQEDILGGSPKGMSPGGSPTRPPKIPKNAFRHFLKAIIPKRSSQVDLWAEAGSNASQHSWAKSSSHGNLVGLNAGLQARGFGSGDLSSTQAPDAHKVAAREDTARQFSGRLHIGHEALRLDKLKISDIPDADLPHFTAAHWLAQKTKNMFGKSKSCTDLNQIDKQPTFVAMETEVK